MSFLTLAINVGNFFYKALILMFVWNWFTPMITEVFSLNYGQAIAGLFVLSALRMKGLSTTEVHLLNDLPKDEKEQIDFQQSIVNVMALSMFLFVAFIAWAIMG